MLVSVTVCRVWPNVSWMASLLRYPSSCRLVTHHSFVPTYTWVLHKQEGMVCLDHLKSGILLHSSISGWFFFYPKKGFSCLLLHTGLWLSPPLQGLLAPLELVTTYQIRNFIVCDIQCSLANETQGSYGESTGVSGLSKGEANSLNCRLGSTFLL